MNKVTSEQLLGPHTAAIVDREEARQCDERKMEALIKWVRDNTALACEPNLTDAEVDHVAMCLAHLKRWYQEGVGVGSFLTAIAKNDFRKACLLADDTNLKVLHLYALFVTNCLGSDYIKRAEKLK